jgi:hypothetical protein
MDINNNFYMEKQKHTETIIENGKIVKVEKEISVKKNSFQLSIHMPIPTWLIKYALYLCMIWPGNVKNVEPIIQPPAITIIHAEPHAFYNDNSSNTTINAEFNSPVFIENGPFREDAFCPMDTATDLCEE